MNNSRWMPLLNLKDAMFLCSKINVHGWIPVVIFVLKCCHLFQRLTSLSKNNSKNPPKNVPQPVARGTWQLPNCNKEEGIFSSWENDLRPSLNKQHGLLQQQCFLIFWSYCQWSTDISHSCNEGWSLERSSLNVTENLTLTSCLQFAYCISDLCLVK